MKNFKNMRNLFLGCLLITNLGFAAALNFDFPLKLNMIELSGNAQNSEFGYSVNRAGDINGDGYDDLIIGAPAQNGVREAVYVVYGGATSSLEDIDLSSTSLDPLTTGFRIYGGEDGSVSIEVNSAGDIDNDGYDDIIIGCYSLNGKGAAFVIYGGEKSSMSNIDLFLTNLHPLTTGFRISGNANDDWLGVSVSAGDINNDGYSDIIVGASNKGAGVAYVIYGGPRSSMSNIDLALTTLNPLTTGFMVTGEMVFYYFGHAVASADINNDGYDDVIIGSQRGAIYVVYGGPKSSMSNLDVSVTPLIPLTTGFKIVEGQGRLFGGSLSRAGDVNNDGFDDIVLGASCSSPCDGAAYVVYGGPKSRMSNLNLLFTPLDPATTGFRIEGDTFDSTFGTSVSSAGDFNRDGYDDVIIGALRIRDGKGAAFVVYGGKNSDMKNIDLSFTKLDSSGSGISILGTSDNERAGTSVGAADLNGDGVLDVIVGAYGKNSKTGAVYILMSQCVGNNKGIKAAAGVFEGIYLAGAVFGSGSSLPLNFGLATKILRNIKYMELPVSPELQKAFISWKTPSNFMKAPDSWSEKYNSETIPEVFSQYCLQSAFLANFWKPFILTLIGLAVFGIFKAIEVFMKEKNRMISTIAKQVNIGASNFALIQFYGNLDDVIFYFVLEMRSTSFETGFRRFSSLLAIFLLLVGGVFIALHSIILKRYQKAKEPSKFANFRLMFKDFKDESSFMQYFLMINLIRSMLTSLIYATLFEHPVVQGSLLLALNILMIIYLCWKRSFKELVNNVGQIFCEVFLFIAHICVLILSRSEKNELSSNSIEKASKCIIAIIYALLLGCALLLIADLAKMLLQTYLERRKTPKSVSSLDQSPEPKIATEGPLFNQSQSIIQANSSSIPLETRSNENLHLYKDVNLTEQREATEHSFMQNQRSIPYPLEYFEAPSSHNEDPEAGK